MITLITGVPGMGKTAMLVHTLLKNEKAGFASRPVFVMGINNLLLEHTQAPPVEQWTEKRVSSEDPSLFLDYYTFPPNSILVVDEAQRVFRNRSSGTKPPPHVMALETHRHTGLDIILLTQKPHLLDINARELVGRHVHIKNTILGRKLFEWFEFNDVTNRSNLDAATKRSYSPPKEVFSLYKSAEVHTKQPRRIHQIWLYLFIATIAMFYFGNKIYSRISEKLHPLQEIKQDVQEPPKNDSNIIQAIQPLNNINNQPAVQEIALVPHPFIGYQFYITGSISSKQKTIIYYRLESENSVIDVTNIQLEKAGYAINHLTDCSSFLFFKGAQITAACKTHGEGRYGALQRAIAPSPNGVSGRSPDVDAFRIGADTQGMKTRGSPENSSPL